MPEKIQSIADILSRTPGLTGINNCIKQAEVVIKFSEIFPDLTRVVSAVKVEKKILFLRAENSVWRNELRLKEKTIVEKVNLFFQENRINNVKFIP